jgi:phytoene synthase
MIQTVAPGIVLKVKEDVCMALRQRSVSPTVASAYEYCRRIAETSKTFYWGSLFVPQPRRRALWAVYAFCRTVDDIADNEMDQARARAAMDHWREALARGYRGQAGDLIMVAWVDALGAYAIPLQPALDLLDGVESDLHRSRYATFAEVSEYSYRVAGTVGLLTLPIFGYADARARTAAVALGIAMQLTNMLRDIGEDARRGRIYLPQEDLDHFGYSEDELLAGVINDAFLCLLEFQMNRAQQYYALARPGISLLAEESRLAVMLSYELYRRILERIRGNAYDVFTKRAFVPMREKILAVPRFWLQVRRSGGDYGAENSFSGAGREDLGSG